MHSTWQTSMINSDIITNKSLAAILNNLSDGFMIMNTRGRVTAFNTVAEQITGYTAAEAKGMICRDILGWEVCIENCPLNSEKPAKTTNIKRELRIRKKDGTHVFIDCTTSVLIDNHGMVMGMVDVFRDISEIKCLEDDLKLSEYKYRRLFEGSKDMIFITTRQGEILDINQASLDLLDYPDKQSILAGGSVERLFSNPMHWKVFQEQIRRNGYVKDFEAGFKKRDGTRVHCLLSGNAVKDSRGAITGYEGIAKDITARMDAYRNLYKRNEDLSLLNSLAVTMNLAHNLEDVLPSVLGKVMERLSLSSGAIVLINAGKSRFEVAVQKGFPTSMGENAGSFAFHDRLLEAFLLKKDTYLPPRSIYPSFRATWDGGGGSGPVDLIGFLITAKEKPSGFMAFRCQERKGLTREDIHLLGSLGNFLGNAIDSINLLDTVQKHREELKNLTAQLFRFQETECRRISRELHDESGQALIGINFTLESVEKHIPPHLIQMKNLIHVIRTQINHTYQEMRNISHRLHPALLTDLGLEPALDSFMAQLAEQTSLDIRFRMIGFSGRLHPDIETVLYRFSQEAISNTVKHARATRFSLSLIQSYPQVIFIAEDDGVGFDLEKQDHERPALGLLSMRERALMLGGKFSLRTSEGNGTRIRIEIPIIHPERSQGRISTKEDVYA